MVSPHARSTCSITSGLSGSPAPTTSRSGIRPRKRPGSACTIIRQTVGGAQNVVTPQRSIVSSSAVASKRGWLTTSTVASASHGAKTLLHACFAQPGEEMLRWTSPGRSPIQYRVVRWPTGYEACVCSTSLAFAVVPEVKYSSSVSSALVRTPSVASGSVCDSLSE